MYQGKTKGRKLYRNSKSYQSNFIPSSAEVSFENSRDHSPNLSGRSPGSNREVNHNYYSTKNASDLNKPLKITMSSLPNYNDILSR